MDTKEMIRELLQQIYDGLNNFETAAKETVKKLSKVNNPMIDEEIITDIEEAVDELLELCEEEYIPFEVMAKEIKNRLHQEINHLKTMIENERKMRNVSDNEKNNKCNKCFLDAMAHDMRDRIYSIEIDNERNVSIYFGSYYEDEGENE